jgi:hypothetical protein
MEAEAGAQATLQAAAELDDEQLQSLTALLLDASSCGPTEADLASTG